MNNGIVKIKRLLYHLNKSTDSDAGTFISILLSILVASSSYGANVATYNGIIGDGIFLLVIIQLFYLFSILPDFLHSAQNYVNEAQELLQQDDEVYYYTTYRTLLLISLNAIILMPIILDLIFNGGKVLTFNAQITYVIDSSLIVATTLLLIASQLIETVYLEKARMFPYKYKKLVFNNHNHVKFAVLTLIFAILSLEVSGANLSENISIFFMLIALYPLFYAFTNLFYIERIRTIYYEENKGTNV
ncbi:MAG: hypothetical protein M1544_00530 [Candidatus Marsarchaeota archaeon]|nr:hypothetical protein [Candidatus Marsarchaeota archaeon]